MKRVLTFVMVVAFMLLTPNLLLAQNDLQVGTRKLNLAKSKFVRSGMAPKGETRTVEAQGDGVKAHTVGIAADGELIDYSYTTRYDGKDSQISGVGFPFGADTLSERRVDAYTTTSIAKKAGKVVLTTRSVISKDGKVTTITAKGTDQNGHPIISTLVWERQ